MALTISNIRNSLSLWKQRAHCGRADFVALILGACILLFSAVVFSFLLGYFFAVEKYTWQPDGVYYYPRWQYQLNRTDPKEENIMETREYQISISSKDYTPRMVGIDRLTEFLRNFTGEKLKEKDADIDIYWETHYKSQVCGHKFSEVRKRIKYDTHGKEVENKTTIDINQDSVPKKDKSTAMKWDLQPNSTYVSEEKIEQDIHKTYYKFNRKTKIKDLPTDFDLETCGDLLELFPYAFDTVGPVDVHTELPKLSSEYAVWEYSFSGKMYYGILKYKFAWTLYYSTVDHARKSNYPPSDSSSEFSFRIYSLGKGYGPWQYDGLVFAAQLYDALLNFDDYPTEQ